MHLFVAIVFLASCSAGITSHTSILNENNSDEIELVDLLLCKGVNEKTTDEKYYAFSISDNKSGKGSYNISMYPKKENSEPFELNFKRHIDSYAIQMCGKEKDKTKCIFMYAMEDGGKYSVFPLWRENISPYLKEVLGSLYNQESNDIELTNGNYPLPLKRFTSQRHLNSNKRVNAFACHRLQIT